MPADTQTIKHQTSSPGVARSTEAEAPSERESRDKYTGAKLSLGGNKH